MFRLNHRSIKVTIFSEMHIKIISKNILTYHQIAFVTGFSAFSLVSYYHTFANFQGMLYQKRYKSGHKHSCYDYYYHNCYGFLVLLFIKIVHTIHLCSKMSYTIFIYEKGFSNI